MQFFARSVSKSIRPLLNSRARQSWVLSQKCHSTFSATESSGLTRGGSGAEKSESLTPMKSSEWARPTEIPYQPKIANSVDLIGYVSQPVQFHAKLDGSFWAGTVITHGPPSASESALEPDSTHKFWIPVIFEGDLAHTANCHLKKNDRVYITGHLFVDVSEISGAKPDLAYVQVMVRDLNYIHGSKSLPQVLSASEQKETVLKHSASLEKRRDFGNDHWFDILEQKETVLKHSASLEKRRDFGNDHWSDLLDKPDEWFDYRESKQSCSVHPRHPDFKKKDGTVALWLNKAPNEILSNLKDVKFATPVTSKYAKQPKAGEESWKDLLENIDTKWWDNRLNKRNEKAPDFKHKETGVALWLSDSPMWVIENLPPPKSKTSDSQ